MGKQPQKNQSKPTKPKENKTIHTQPPQYNRQLFLLSLLKRGLRDESLLTKGRHLRSLSSSSQEKSQIANLLPLEKKNKRHRQLYQIFQGSYRINIKAKDLSEKYFFEVVISKMGMLYLSYLTKMIKFKLYSFHLILWNHAYPSLIQTLISTTISEASNHSCFENRT